MTEVPNVQSPLDAYECVLLYDGPASGDLDEATVEGLAAQHVAHLLSLQERGVVLAAGDVDGASGVREPLRGFGLCRTGSVDDVRELVEADPAVQAGLYRVDVTTFVTPQGSFAFPHAAAS
jgi:uncharacterized protein YciI